MAISVQIAEGNVLRRAIWRGRHRIEGSGLESAVAFSSVDHSKGAGHYIGDAVSIEIGDGDHRNHPSRIGRNDEGDLFEGSITVSEKDGVAPNEVELLIVVQIGNQQARVWRGLGCIQVDGGAKCSVPVPWHE